VRPENDVEAQRLSETPHFRDRQRSVPLDDETDATVSIDPGGSMQCEHCGRHGRMQGVAVASGRLVAVA
jgi:hypothetical protein